ncbi:MAG: sigma-70 family RNA polymerase sigma factor [Myxococcaceae bacterium]|nr:sigma-70 family RNA polymerase sigma factor [Myxococcaceae bacterium]
MAHLFALPMVVPDEPPASEGVLVQRARAGDAGAFRALFERHGPMVWRFLRDIFRDDTAADEATQETFVRAHARLSQLRDGERVAAWLLGIARHVWREARRPRPLELAGTAEECESRVEDVLPTPTPEDLLLDRELEGLLADALGALREERRAALLLRIDHGLAYEEIAVVMGWTLPKVKNEIHRARLQLRERLAAHVGRHR